MKKDNISPMEVFDMWRHGDAVYMKLGEEEYIFNYQDFINLPDLDEMEQPKGE